MMVTPRYVGRYAPSPTGPLHAGSMVAALASWLDAKAHGGQWRVRIEDVDTPRCVPEAEAQILRQLAACGLHPDGPVWHQSQRGAAYAGALAQLQRAGLVYGCACSRQDIARAHGGTLATGQVLPYPGTCRHGTHGKPVRAWRLHTQRAGWLRWHDRRLGWQQQWLAREVGDVVLRRADGLWAYQLAVVVDDAAQGITDVVRGEDLVDNTPRQRLLQQVLGLPRLRYLHTPLVRNARGHKLSKQTGAAAVATETDAEVRHTLTQAAQALALHAPQAWQPVPHWLAQAVAQWARRWGL
jgi:glutamyl-Q tRNA(Asp) synthetase